MTRSHPYNPESYNRHLAAKLNYGKRHERQAEMGNVVPKNPKPYRAREDKSLKNLPERTSGHGAYYQAVTLREATSALKRHQEQFGPADTIHVPPGGGALGTRDNLLNVPVRESAQVYKGRVWIHSPEPARVEPPAPPALPATASDLRRIAPPAIDAPERPFLQPGHEIADPLGVLTLPVGPALAALIEAQRQAGPVLALPNPTVKLLPALTPRGKALQAAHRHDAQRRDERTLLDSIMRGRWLNRDEHCAVMTRYETGGFKMALDFIETLLDERRRTQRREKRLSDLFARFQREAKALDTILPESRRAGQVHWFVGPEGAVSPTLVAPPASHHTAMRATPQTAVAALEEPRLSGNIPLGKAAALCGVDLDASRRPATPALIGNLLRAEPLPKLDPLPCRRCGESRDRHYALALKAGGGALCQPCAAELGLCGCRQCRSGPHTPKPPSAPVPDGFTGVPLEIEARGPEAVEVYLCSIEALPKR